MKKQTFITIILIIVIGLAITILSLLIVNKSIIKIDNLEINLPTSETDTNYTYNLKAVTCDMAPRFLEYNRGFPAIVSYKSTTEGCMQTYVKISDIYPIGFIINWAFYSALVGAGALGVKKIKNRKT